MIRKTRKELDGAPEVDVKLSSHLSYLTTGAASALDKLRALAKHEQRAAQSLTPDQRDAAIVSMVEDMPVDRRRKLLARLNEFDAAGELLG